MAAAAAISPIRLFQGTATPEAQRAEGASLQHAGERALEQLHAAGHGQSPAAARRQGEAGENQHPGAERQPALHAGEGEGASDRPEEEDRGDAGLARGDL